jgi:hypothetical protein
VAVDEDAIDIVDNDAYIVVYVILLLVAKKSVQFCEINIMEL